MVRKVFLFGIMVLLGVGGAVWYYHARTSVVRPVAPPRSTLDSVLQVPLSTLRVPLEFSLRDLEATVNKKLSGTFKQGWMPVGDKQRDSIYLGLERFDQVRLNWQPGQLTAAVPLRIEFKFSKVAAGVRISSNKPVVAEVVVRLKSNVQLDNAWGLKPTTQLDTVIWKMEPTLKVAFVNVNLRGFADKYLNRNADRLTHQFDSLMHEMLDSRKVVQKIWKDIHQPIVIKKQEPQIGLITQAEALSLRWIESDADKIAGLITLKARVFSWFESPPVIEPALLPPYRTAPGQQEELDLYVKASLSFHQINSFINRHLDKASINFNTYVLQLHRAELYSSGQELVMELRVKGALKGKVYLRALPYFDSVTHAIGLRQFRYDLSTEEILLTTADWMLHDNLVAMLADTVKYNLTPELQELPHLIEGAVARGKSGNKINLSVDSLAITVPTTLVTRNDIQWILSARGKAGIELKKKVLEGKSK
ncbi:MAG: DUF4403 family protein [Cytophagales bacterium]|nr:DUF4403 family protein [Cytophagales bacterium]